MKTAPHPLLAGLWRDGAAPAQAVARWQAQRELLTALSQALQQADIDDGDPWQALLRVPLAPGDGDAALRSALQSLDEVEPDQDPPVAMPAAPRGVAQGLAPSIAATQPAGIRTDAIRAAAAGSAEPATPPRRTAAVQAPRTISASAAAAHWQQRVQAAGLADAYRTPLRSEGGGAPAARSGVPGSRGIEAAPPPAALVASTISAPFAALAPAEAAREMHPAAERIEVLLARLRDNEVADRPSAAARARRPCAGTDTVASAAAQSATSGIGPVDPSAAPPSAQPAHRDAPSTGPAGFGGGLRGLAARAAAQAFADNTAAVAAAPSAAAAQPAVDSARDAGWPAEAPLPPPDDDRLAERLAQMLRREALRDGIDLSEVRP
jgi:hypothetical protein